MELRGQQQVRIWKNRDASRSTVIDETRLEGVCSILQIMMTTTAHQQPVACYEHGRLSEVICFGGVSTEPKACTIKSAQSIWTCHPSKALHSHRSALGDICEPRFRCPKVLHDRG